MSLNEEERKVLVSLEYEKALSIFSQIEGLQSLGYWDNIANRLFLFVGAQCLPSKVLDAIFNYR